MDDKTKIEKLNEVIGLLLPHAEARQIDAEERINTNPAYSAVAQTVRRNMERAKLLLSEIYK